MSRIRIKLAIPASEYIRYYQGEAKQVYCTASDGRRVRFPAEILKPFLLHEGIYGEFDLWFDDKNRFLEIKKLDAPN